MEFAIQCEPIAKGREREFVRRREGSERGTFAIGSRASTRSAETNGGRCLPVDTSESIKFIASPPILTRRLSPWGAPNGRAKNCIQIAGVGEFLGGRRIYINKKR